MLRAVLLQIHRYSGLATFAFLAIASITGCILIFRGPIDHALNRDLFDTTTAAVAVRVCQCSASARPTTHADSSQPSFVCHHYSWDTVMLQVQAGPTGPIALAGLVNSLHASSSACPPGPVSVVP